MLERDKKETKIKSHCALNCPNNKCVFSPYSRDFTRLLEAFHLEAHFHNAFSFRPVGYVIFQLVLNSLNDPAPAQSNTITSVLKVFFSFNISNI